MAETERSGPLLWNVNKFFLLLMVLPAIGLIAASFPVSKDALTDDGYPLNIFLLIPGAFFLLSNATVFLFLFISNRNKLEMIQNGGSNAENSNTQERYGSSDKVHPRKPGMILLLLTDPVKETDYGASASYLSTL